MDNSKFMLVLPDNMRKELQIIADKYNISLASVVKMAITEYMEGMKENKHEQND